MNWDKETTERILREVQSDLREGRISDETFKMEYIIGQSGCGTVACIAGHMILRRAEENGRDLSECDTIQELYHNSPVYIDRMANASGRRPALMSLFYDWEPVSAGTRAEAVQAIDNYFAGKEKPWHV